MSAQETFRARDPATGEALEPEFRSASARDVAQVAVAAAAAFSDFSRRSGLERGRLLRTIAEGIEALGERLVERVHRETGLAATRLVNERARTCGQLRMFAEVAESESWIDERVDAGDASRVPTPRPEVRSRLRPIGPVAVFGASNFPLAFSVAGGDTSAALAVGCPVIVKAHPAHPATSELVGRVINDAVAACGLPQGVFSLLFDAAHEAGLALVRHPAVKAGAFTGSRAGGLALLRAAQERAEPIPFFAEMSSVNPVFVFPGALREDVDAFAKGFHASMTLGCGQFCTQPGLLFVRGDAQGQRLVERLAALVQDTTPATMLTRDIAAAYREGVARRANVRGVRMVAVGDPPTTRAIGASADVNAALLVTDVETFRRTPILAEELFGPCSLVVVCGSTGDFLPCAETLSGQLTATVWADDAGAGDFERGEAGVSQLLFVLEQKAGRLVCNGFPTGVEVGTAMVHGGPFPATTDARFTSVGTRSILRFVRPVAYQFPAR